MRLVATSDTHVPVDPSIIPDGDVFIHAGDLMTTGYPDDFSQQLEWLAELPHPIKLYTPGNHDFQLMVYPGPALQDLRRVGVTVLGLPGNEQYYTSTLPNGLTVLGLPYVTNLPRWAFNLSRNEELDLVETIRHKSYKRADIIMSHSPVKGILDLSARGHQQAGMDAYRTLVDEEIVSPKLWFSGHIHEAYGHTNYKGIDFYNVSLCDRGYKHINPPIVLDFDKDNNVTEIIEA